MGKVPAAGDGRRETDASRSAAAARSSTDAGRCSLTAPTDLTFLPVIQAFVRAFASRLGFADRELGDIDVAVEEATTNVILDAFAPGEEATFDVTCERVPAGLAVSFRDMGLPWDPALAPTYSPEADLRSQDGAGLGTFLLRRLMDEYEFVNHGVKGKETRLVKYLEGTSVVPEGDEGEGAVEGGEAAAAPAAAASPPGPAPQPAVVSEIGIALLRPEQAVEVSRCIYDAYRYTYVNEHVYYPDRVVALNECGDLVSAVAATADGEVAGHAALIFKEEVRDVAELGIVATKERFRGHSVATRMTEFLVEDAERRSLVGLSVTQVTAHPYSQRFSHDRGFRDCGLLLAHQPASVSFKGILEERSQRGSAVLGFRYLRPRDGGEVFAPAPHAEMVARLYDGLGAAVTVRDGGSQPVPDTLTSISSTVRSLARVGVVAVGACGADGAVRLREHLHKLVRDGVEAIELSLPLGDAATPWLAGEAEALGFLFTGLAPGGADGDGLLMIYLNGVVADYDAIVMDDPATRDLLDYVRGHDRLA